MKKISLLSALILSVSIVQAQIGINTTDPQAALHVDGDLIVTETPLAPDTATVEPLYVSLEGLVLKGPKEVLSPFAYFAIDTRREMMNITTADRLLTDYNNSIPISFQVQESDVVFNSLKMKVLGEFIRVGTAGVYEIHSFIGFRFWPRNGSTPVYMHIVLQKSRDNGRTWVDQRVFRPIQTVHWRAEYVPIVFPTIIVDLEYGDLLRLVFTRAKYSSPLGEELEGLQISSGFSNPSFQFFMRKL